MKLELSLHASKLKNVAGAFKGTSDPFAVVTKMATGPGTQAVVIGQTEVVKNNLSPDWAKSLNFDFELGTPVKLAISIFDKNSKGKDGNMGSTLFDVDELLGARGNCKAKKLKKGGTLYATVRKSQGSGNLRLKMRGVKLKNVEGMFSKSDPFFEIARKTDAAGGGGQSWDSVYRSKDIHNNLNPNWPEAVLELAALCAGDLDLPLRFTVFDHEKSGKHTLMGTFESSVNALVSAAQSGTNMAMKKKGKTTGTIVIEKASVSGVDEITQGMAATTLQPGYGAPPPGAPYGAPPPGAPYGAPPPGAPYGAPPPGAPGGYGAPPPGAPGGYGAPPPGAPGGYGAPPPGAPYGAPPPPYGAPPPGAPYGAPPGAPGGYGAPPPGAPGGGFGGSAGAYAAGAAVVGAAAVGAAAYAASGYGGASPASSATAPPAGPAPVTGLNFVDYVSGGCELNVVVAIDFTGSNGDPRKPGTLHYIFGNPGDRNDYEKAIAAIVSIVAKYDSDQMFPVYGFGAKYGGIVRHCFQCGESVEAQGVDGVLGAYRRVFKTGLVMSGPTVFDEVIDAAAARANMSYQSKAQEGGQSYTVLLILTDGAVTDVQKTAAAIERASSSPLSIVIVGVGNADFSAMRFLDDMPTQRDIAQFVPFNQFSHDSIALTSETLEEIPQQVTSYFQSRGVSPNPGVTRNESRMTVDEADEVEIDLSLDVSNENEIHVTGGGNAYVDGFNAV